MADIIAVERLKKAFGDFTAVDGISFRVREGEIFGFLGPNGAGKTTTLSMLGTLALPTAGKALVNGHDVATDRDEVRHSIGIVFQDPTLDDELTAYENMDFHGRLYGVPPERRKERIAELLALVELDDRKDDLVKTYSGGMKRRLEIARGLLHEPKVLFLDEPTVGLDPQTRNKLWEHIRKLNEDKRITIILTTHYMDEADRLCHRVAIVDHGRIIALATPKELKERIGGEVITVKTPDKETFARLMEKEPWCISVKVHDGTVTINAKGASRHIAGMVTLAEKHRIKIDSIMIQEPSLEDVFLHFTGKTIREQEASAVDSLRMRRRMMHR